MNTSNLGKQTLNNVDDQTRVQPRLRSIDALRGIAALAVLLGHIRHHKQIVTIDARFWLLFPLDFGYLGVALFLVISGFCIHLRAAKRLARTGELRSDWRNFWSRRFFRLYPPYVIAIAISVGVYYFATPTARAPWQNIVSLPADLLTHLLMVHNLFIKYSYGLGNSAFWTLGLEEQLYALYALYFVLRRSLSSRRVLLIVTVVSILWRVGAFFAFRFLPSAETTFKWADWPFAYWFLWVLGALAAEAHVGALRLPRWCYDYRIASIMAGGAVIINPLVLSRLTGSHYIASKLGVHNHLLMFDGISVASDPLFAVAFFVILNAWVRSERSGGGLSSKLTALSTVGTFSYSIYLTHLPVLVAGETIFPSGDGVWSLVFRYVFYVPLVLCVGRLFFVAVERRFLIPPANFLSPAHTGSTHR